MNRASAVWGGPNCEAGVFWDSLLVGTDLLLPGEAKDFFGDGVFKIEGLLGGGVFFEGEATGLHAAGLFFGETSGAHIKSSGHNGQNAC